jgi:M6 family metalloprotease-like protein
MPLRNSSRKRSRAALSGVATAALALAGLALTSTPTTAAPAAAAAAASPSKFGYAGAPVNPAPYTVTQPDGSSLRVRDFGDHLAHGTATVKGNYSVVKGGDGVWRYAAGLTRSGKLKASSVVAGKGTPPAAARGLVPAPSAKPTPSKAPMGGTGNDKELVILVEFQDVQHHASGSTEADWANHYFGATGSVDDFYDEASQGSFGVKPATESCGTPNDGVTNWIQLPMNHPNTGVDGSATEQYIADAIKATESCVDYASFDGTNGQAPDGEITTDELHVTIIGAGFETSYGGDECGKSIWGHEWDLESAGITAPTVDGKTIGNSGYTTFGEWHCNAGDDPGHKATMGIMAHEFGHDINWPDLYDTDQSGEGTGEWSLMGSGSWGESTGPGAEPGDSPSYPDAWALYYQGWVMPTVATVSDNLAVEAHQSLLLGPNPGGTDWLFGEHRGTGEYFMLENRTQQGYDVSTPGCGIVIYRIDETVTPSNGANSDETDPLVKVMQADGDEDLENGANRGDAGDPWPGTTGNHDFDNSSTPNTKFHDGTPSNLDLHVDENSCASTMHVEVSHLGDPSPVPEPPANDDFADAVALTGNSGNTTGTNDNATLEPGEPEVVGHGGASVWYTWTPSVSGTATLTMDGSDYDTVLGVFTGTAVNALTLVAENDDEDNPNAIYTSKVVTPVTAGTTYRISADGYDGDTGSIDLAWSIKANPTVTAVHMPEPSTFGSPSTVVVNVTGTAGVATGNVTVKEGSTTLGTGTLSAGSATINLPATLPVGTHALTASYAGNADYNAGAANVTATVVAAPPTQVASTTTASAPKKVKFKQDFDVTATVTAAGVTPTGTVQVFDGSKLIGTGTLVGGTVKIHVKKNLKSGKHTLTVKYLGSAEVTASQTTVKVKVKKKKKKKKHHHR